MGNNQIQNLDLIKFTAITNSIEFDDYIQEPDKVIYHYTSPTGFKSIIENKKMRFTDNNYLNDYTEGKYSLDLCYKNMDMLFENYEGVKEAFKDAYDNNDLKKYYPYNHFQVFQCFFSSNPDSLGLWNYYTKSDGIQGYNIGFNSKKCNGLHNKETDSNFKKLKLERRTFIGKVIYSEEKQLEIIKGIISKYSDFFAPEYKNRYGNIIHVIMDKIKSIGVFFKPECFKMEEEVRIAFYFENNDYQESEKTIKGIDNVELNYFVRGGLFIPYFDVPFETDIVQEIHFSPTLKMAETKNNVYRFLNFNGFNIKDSKIIESNIPVRF